MDVRDDLQRSLEYLGKVKAEEESSKDQETLKKHIDQIAVGIQMTSSIMDAALKKLGVLTYDPLGQKFDPN